ncbi:MAG: MATE family efflux transporter [Erysipelotrichaceae bacterium]|nr:MATE family efflux transporter [Erysipelotrichaceae bacterium]
MEFVSKLIEPRKQISKERKRFSDSYLKQMILPLFIETLLLMVVGLADTMMVSHAGEATVSGVSLDTMIYTIFILVFSALGSGGAVIVSQYIGKGDKGRAETSASQIFHLAFVISMILMVILLAGGKGLLRLLYGSVDPEVMKACETYLWIVTLSFPANALYNAGTALHRAMGKTAVTMRVSMAMNLVNVIGNAIGIFVLHAGAAGVAWPTTISWYFAACIMTVLCFRKTNEVTVSFRKMVRLIPETAGRILRVAVPNAVESGLFQAAKVLLGSLIATFGTSQIAANGIGQTIWSLSATVVSAMSPAFITVIGRCIGAGDREAADYYLWKLLRITTLLTFAWNALILLCLPLILPLYDITEETRYLLIVIVIIHNLFCGTIGAFFGPMSAGLRAAGDVRFTMIASIFCTVFFRTAMSFILCLGFRMGVIGIACAMVMDWCLKGLLCVMRYRSGKWLQHQLI